MKLLASFILSFGWLGIAYTQYDLIQVQMALPNFVFSAIANVLTPLCLLVAVGIYSTNAIVSLPRFNSISCLMALMAIVPLVYFYGPLVYALVQDVL